MKKIIIFVFFLGLIALPIFAAGDLKRPNLAKAQYYIDQALLKITDAQKANERDLGGHAAKAKTHLEAASEEIKLADIKGSETPGGGSIEEDAVLKDHTLTESEQNHPNLAKAQLLIDAAQQRITDAQNANEFDMGGHAAKAKTHLEEGIKEVKLAAEEATKH